MILSPIAFFVYNRPEHTKKTLESLKKNKLASKSNIYIFSDAARDRNSIKEVNQVRDLIKKIDGFKKKENNFEKKKFWFS